MIPGMNILNVALTVIAPQNIIYYKDSGRSNNEIGLDVTRFDDPVTIRGSAQAFERASYAEYGLDLQRNYLMAYIPKDAISLDRDISGDQISYDGARYQTLKEVKWFPQDGWVSLLCVEIPFA